MPNSKHLLTIGTLAFCLTLAACERIRVSQGGTGTPSEPDKVLFDRATENIQRGRYTEARLALQTLINTYPDSEYLAKAKLAVADSQFQRGWHLRPDAGCRRVSGFHHLFFPFLDEAAYAQMQVGMTHYRRMEKPDRDRNEAIEAEGAFQTYLPEIP